MSNAGIRDLVNRLCYRDSQEGRTPLAYAVCKNLDRVASDLLDLGIISRGIIDTNNSL